jgi:hypothetical protein
MKPVNLFFSLSLCCALGLVLTPGLLPASTNAQPWGEQEAERDAQEEITFAEKSAQEEMGSSIYGRIISIDQDAKVLSLLPTDQVENKEEEDDDGDTSQDYHFKSDTALTGMSSFSELSAGDYVTLDYFTFRDKNRITEVSFDKHGRKEGTSKENNASEAKEYSPGVLVG